MEIQQQNNNQPNTKTISNQQQIKEQITETEINAVKLLKTKIDEFISSQTQVSIFSLRTTIENEINVVIKNLQRKKLKDVNQLFLNEHVLIKTKEINKLSENSVELFYMNHIQITIRLISAVYFCRNKDPLPLKYLNSVVFLLNNMRTLLDEVGGLMLHEYFNVALQEKYVMIPKSIEYIHGKIDFNLSEYKMTILDRIIQAKDEEVQKEVSLEQPKFFIQQQPKKKETFDDIINSKKKRNNTKASFHMVAMKNNCINKKPKK